MQPSNERCAFRWAMPNSRPRLSFSVMPTNGKHFVCVDRVIVRCVKGMVWPMGWEALEQWGDGALAE